eukprot:8012940-Alexandrium_andersonii.AAC.1
MGKAVSRARAPASRPTPLGLPGGQLSAQPPPGRCPRHAFRYLFCFGHDLVPTGIGLWPAGPLTGFGREHGAGT